MKRVLFCLCLVALISLLTVTLLSCSEQPAVTTAETTSNTAETTAHTLETTAHTLETTSNTVETTVAPNTTETLVNGLPNYVDGKLFIIEDGKTNYRVTFAQGANAKPGTGPVFSKRCHSAWTGRYFCRARL